MSLVRVRAARAALGDCGVGAEAAREQASRRNEREDDGPYGVMIDSEANLGYAPLDILGLGFCIRTFSPFQPSWYGAGPNWEGLGFESDSHRNCSGGRFRPSVCEAVGAIQRIPREQPT